MKKNIKFLEKKINLKIKNKELFLRALTHKSFNKNNNNEKLEFIGDRVIGLILSKKLFDLYPYESEGILDKRFAKLVNRETCCSISLSIGLNNFIILGDSKKQITKKDDKILSDACEALIGAIFLEKGFSYTSKIVLHLWRHEIIKSNVTVLDSKTELQEYSLKNFKKLPIYKHLGSKGPRHKPTFKISVSITNSKVFFGYGSSKQQAEQDGAEKLINTIKYI